MTKPEESEDSISKRDRVILFLASEDREMGMHDAVVEITSAEETGDGGTSYGFVTIQPGSVLIPYQIGEPGAFYQPFDRMKLEPEAVVLIRFFGSEVEVIIAFEPSVEATPAPG